MLNRMKKAVRKAKNVSPLLKNRKFMEYDSGTFLNTGEYLNVNEASRKSTLRTHSQSCKHLADHDCFLRFGFEKADFKEEGVKVSSTHVFPQICR